MQVSSIYQKNWTSLTKKIIAGWRDLRNSNYKRAKIEAKKEKIGSKPPEKLLRNSWKKIITFNVIFQQKKKSKNSWCVFSIPHNPPFLNESLLRCHWISSCDKCWLLAMIHGPNISLLWLSFVEITCTKNILSFSSYLHTKNSFSFY